jgi:hypothetical protein
LAGVTILVPDKIDFIQNCKKRQRRALDEINKKNNGGSEHVQNTLYSCMELSQRNPLILLMYANSKIK